MNISLISVFLWLTPLLMCFIAVYSLWVFYITVMSLRDKKEAGQFRALDFAFGYPTLFVGYIVDFVVNMIPATILYLEIPQETTLSSRSLRHARAQIANPDLLDKWRKYLATWLLDSIGWYDKHGGHTA